MIARNLTKFLIPRVDEFFCIINFSRTEGGEKVVNVSKLRERIKKKALKGENKTFKYKEIIRDYRR